MSDKKSEVINGKPVAGYELNDFVSKMIKKAGVSFDVSDTIKRVVADWKTDADWKDVLSCHGGVNGEEVFVVPPDKAELLAETLLMEDYPEDFGKFYRSLLSGLALRKPLQPKHHPLPRPPAKASKGHVLLDALVADEVRKLKFQTSPEPILNQLVSRRMSSLYLQDIITNVEDYDDDFEVAEEREGELRKHLRFMHEPGTQSMNIKDFIPRVLRGLPAEKQDRIYRKIMAERRKNSSLARQMVYLRDADDGPIFALLKEDWTAFGDLLVDNYGPPAKPKKEAEEKEKKAKPKPVPATVTEPVQIPKPVKSSQSTSQARPRSDVLPAKPATGLYLAVLGILDKKNIRLNPYLVENSILNRTKRNPLLQKMIFLRGEGRDEEHVVLDTRLGYLEDLIVKEYSGSVPNLESGPAPKHTAPKPEAHELSDDEVAGLRFAISGILTKEKIGLNPYSVEEYILNRRRRDTSLKEMVFMKVWGRDKQFVVPKDRLNELGELIVRKYGRPEQGQQRKGSSIPLLTLIERIFDEEGIKEDSFAAAETLLSRRASEFQIQKMVTKVEGSGNPPRYAVLPENQEPVRKYMLYHCGSHKTTGLDEFVADVFKILRNRFELSDLRQATLDRDQKRVVYNLMQERKNDSGLADMIPYCDREPRKSIYRVFEEDAESLQEYIIEYIKELKQVRKYSWQHKKKPSAARPPRPAKPVLPAKPDSEIDEPDADTRGIVRALKSARSPTYEPEAGPLKSEGDDFEIELEEFVSELVGYELMAVSVGWVVSDLKRRMKNKERPLTSLIKEHDIRTHSFAYGVEDDKSQGLRKYIIKNYAAKKIDLEGTTSVLDACRIYIGHADSDVEKGMTNVMLAAVGGNPEFSESVIFPGKMDSASWRVKKGKIGLFLRTLKDYDLPYCGGKIQPSMKARRRMGLDD